MENPCVRFDDLSPGGSGSFGLVGRADTLVARRLDEVVPVIAAAERASQEGYWAAGFVSYEAAPALNAILPVRAATLHDPMRELPLAYFQTFSTRIELSEISSEHFPAGAYNVSSWSPDASRSDYRDSLALTGRAIMSGEIARGKHTFRLRAAFSGDPAAMYRDLLLSQRGPHAACIDTGRFRIVSASPERFFRRAGDILTLRPVLASVRRGRWLEEDQQLAAVLSAEAETSYTNRTVVKEIESELAELGEITSIPLQERLTVERLETLWNLTAKMAVRLRPGIGLLAILRALFPPVSVTGVPKPEAMDLITTTEDTPRGAYCGTIGFLSPEGSGGPDASFSVAVRTVVVDQEEGVAEYGVGSAITGTSDAVNGYEEARLKAKILVERRPEFRLVEVFRVEDGIVRSLDEKLDTLVDSARYFGFEIDRSVAAGAVRDVARRSEQAVVTISVDRSGAIGAETAPAPVWAETFSDAGVAVGAIADQALSTDNVFLFHRTSDCRLRELLARQYPDAETIVLTNEQEEVAGTVDGSVAVKVGESWLTPPRGCGTAPGAFRTRLIDSGVLSVRVVTREQLLEADEVAVVDDVHGWRLIDLSS